MSEQDWFNRVALGVAVAILIGVGAGLGIAGGFSSGAPSSASSPSSSATPVHLYLTISFNPGTGADEYFPANFSVPAHTPVILTITSFDNGTNLVPAMYAMVAGTVGNTEMVTEHGVTHAMPSVPTNGIAHTFTMMSMSSGGMGGGMAAGGGAAVNLPIPSAPSMSDPVTVSAELYFNATGTYGWECMAPCDPNAMATMGLMAGVVTVD
jgi:hypothetical protein